MKTATVGEIESQFKDFVKASEAGPVVVTEDGRPIAILVGIEDEEDMERLLMGCSLQLRAILDRSWREIEEGRGIPHDEFWKRAAARASAKRKTSGKANGKAKKSKQEKKG